MRRMRPPGRRSAAGRATPANAPPKQAPASPARSRASARLVIALLRQRDELLPVGRAAARGGAALVLAENDAARVGDLLGREESGAAARHGDQGLARDGPVEAEEEEMGVALPQELLNCDGVADGLPGGGQVAVEFDGRVEQAVGAAAAHDEVDPEPGREEEVGLAGLDRDAHRRPAAVEVPRVGQDVVLGDDAPRPEAPLVPVDLQDAVD